MLSEIETQSHASQASTFEITHAPDPAIANPDLRTVVLQVRTYGTELDLSTVKLRYADESGGTVGLAPDAYVELWRVPFGGLDPQNTSNQSTSLSDAIEFTLAP